MKKIVFLFLILCVYFSGNAQKDLDVNRFENYIKGFEYLDTTQNIPKNGILFIGSSSIRFWKTLSEDMAPLPVINRGFGGAVTREVIHYFDRLIPVHNPQIIVVYVGENDIADGDEVDFTVSNFIKLSAMIQEKLPNTYVYYVSIKPSVLRWELNDRFTEANEKYKTAIKKLKNTEYIDVYSLMLKEDGNVRDDIFISDNLHMNTDGYAIWTSTIKPLLEKRYRK